MFWIRFRWRELLTPNSIRSWSSSEISKMPSTCSLLNAAEYCPSPAWFSTLTTSSTDQEDRISDDDPLDCPPPPSGKGFSADVGVLASDIREVNSEWPLIEGDVGSIVLFNTSGWQGRTISDEGSSKPFFSHRFAWDIFAFCSILIFRASSCWKCHFDDFKEKMNQTVSINSICFNSS